MNTQTLIYALVSIFNGFATGILAFFIFIKKERRVVDFAWTMMLITVAGWCLCTGIGYLQTTGEKYLFWIRYNNRFATFIPSFFLHFIVLFCGYKDKKRLVNLSYLFSSLIVILSFILPWLPEFKRGQYFLFTPTFPGYLYVVYTTFFVIITSLAYYLLIKKLKNSSGLLYSQLRLICMGTLCGFITGGSTFPNGYGFEIPWGIYGFILYPVVITYAILSRRLFDLEIFIKKSFVYSVLVTLVTLIYFTLVFVGEKLLQGFVGYQSHFISLFAACIIAILFNPLRSTIQKFLDYRFFKGTLESLALEHERLKSELFHTEKLAYVGKMASSIVHEIKNPLTAIKSFCEYMPQKRNDEQFVYKFSNLIPNEIARIEGAVSQLLDLAKPQDPCFEELNIRVLIESTLSLLEHNFKEDSVSFKITSPDEDILIYADEGQLRQVFLNLFLNAIDAMPNGGNLTITISREGRNNLIVVIKDTGKGIEQENLPKLFTPFFTTKPDGIGLGLAIVQEIIKSHQGNIEVESEVDKGTKFTVRLPFHQLGTFAEIRLDEH